MPSPPPGDPGPRVPCCPPSGALAAVFTHGVSRNGDPHIHSHVVLANLVHGTDGRWGACDRRGIAAHRTAAAAVYEAHLRAGLTAALGVRWTGSPGRAAEVAGVGPELLAEFSSRSADIRRHMDEWGAHSGRGARIAWAATRPAKEPGDALRRPRGPMAAKSPRGRRRSRAGSAPHRRGPAVLDEHRFAGVIALPAHGGAHRRDVVTAFGTAAPDGASAAVVERLVAQWVPRRATRRGRAAATAPNTSSRPITICARWDPGRSTPTITRSGWVPPGASTPTGRDGASPTRRSRSARGRGREPWPRCRPTASPITSVPGARSQSPGPGSGWREPVTVERGLGR